jgi:hypothetical protein
MVDGAKKEVIMTYTLTLPCGCTVQVVCDPQTRAAHTRAIERRGLQCRRPGHSVGTRIYLWDFLPDPDDRAEHQVRADGRVGASHP